jgi:hypothetical protein
VGISQPGIIALPRLLAVEVLLSEPESLGDDVLEACLYILRDRLRGGRRVRVPRPGRPGLGPTAPGQEYFRQTVLPGAAARL